MKLFNGPKYICNYEIKNSQGEVRKGIYYCINIGLYDAMVEGIEYVKSITKINETSLIIPKKTSIWKRIFG